MWNCPNIVSSDKLCPDHPTVQTKIVTFQIADFQTASDLRFPIDFQRRITLAVELSLVIATVDLCCSFTFIFGMLCSRRSWYTINGSLGPSFPASWIKTVLLGAFTLLTSRLLKSRHFDPTIYTCAKNGEVSVSRNFTIFWLVVRMCDHRLQCMHSCMQYAWGPRILIHVSKSAHS